MKKENWVHMPHPAHFCASSSCRFVLATYVGKYIVSTVGELHWDNPEIQKIHAKIHDPQWLSANQERRGDDFDQAYMKRFGFEPMGAGEETYETMVFKAEKSTNKCCPYRIMVSSDVDGERYLTDEEAVKGHAKYCQKWSK